MTQTPSLSSRDCNLVEEKRREGGWERQKAIALEYIREVLLWNKCPELLGHWVTPVGEWGSETNSWRAVSEDSVKGEKEVASGRGP